MKVIKKVDFDYVLGFFDQEHRRDDGHDFNTNEWARGFLIKKNGELGDNWSLVELAPGEIIDIFLPHHQGEDGSVVLIGREGSITNEAIARLKRLSDYQNTNKTCWEKISRWSGKELSPIFLYSANSKLFHIDGLHRLLAWGLKNHQSNIQAFINQTNE